STPLPPQPHMSLGETRNVRRAFTSDPEKISFFEKAVVKILNELRAPKLALSHQVDKTERLVIVAVNSPTTNGYLIMTSTATTVGLREIAVNVRDLLADLLRQEGKMFEFGSAATVLCSEHLFLNENEKHLEFSHVAELGDG